MIAARFAAMLVICVTMCAADLTQVHGSGDAYSAPGVALAWAVLRGADESDTAVVVRIATDPSIYAMAAAVGVDPFTQQTQTRLPASKVDRALELRMARSSFADFPRTEFRFFRSGADAEADMPQLVVYFAGVPDTTPEFADAAALDAYLAGRTEPARVHKGSP